MFGGAIEVDESYFGGKRKGKRGRGQVSAPIFILVPLVKLRKRLDLARDAEKVAGRVPGLIVEKWQGRP